MMMMMMMMPLHRKAAVTSSQSSRTSTTIMPNCRIENKDSKAYELSGKVSGSGSKISIPNSTSPTPSFIVLL
jgi:hypothetical protein